MPPDTTTIILAQDTVRLALVDGDGEKSVPEVEFDSIMVEHYRPGDVNGSCGVDIDDIVYLIQYIFGGGPEPVCYKSGDANGDGAIDIDDVVYIINYIFLGGPPPRPFNYTPDCDEQQPSPRLVVGNAELTIIAAMDEQRSIVSHTIDADQEIQALQFEYEIRGDVRDIKVQSLIDGIQEFHGIVDNVLKVGLLDLYGQAMIPAGGAEIINISFVGDGEIELVSSIAVARTGGRLNTTRNSLVADAIVPKSYVLYQNKPNPFNPATEIAFTLPSPSHVKLDVLNILGQNVTTLIDGYRPAGDHTVTWEGRDGNGGPAASGVYFYRIEAGSFTKCKKMLLLK
jgi:hypothetical protein